MSQPKTRRELALLATGGLVASGLLAASKPAAAERQPIMVRARSALDEALRLLQEASADKGGHRVAAMNFIKQAIAEVDAGIHFDNATPYR